MIIAKKIISPIQLRHCSFTEPEVLLIMNRSRKEEKVHGVSECALIAQCYNMAKEKAQSING